MVNGSRIPLIGPAVVPATRPCVPAAVAAAAAAAVAGTQMKLSGSWDMEPVGSCSTFCYSQGSIECTDGFLYTARTMYPTTQ